MKLQILTSHSLARASLFCTADFSIFPQRYLCSSPSQAQRYSSWLNLWKHAEIGCEIDEDDYYLNDDGANCANYDDGDGDGCWNDED